MNAPARKIPPFLLPLAAVLLLTGVALGVFFVYLKSNAAPAPPAYDFLGHFEFQNAEGGTVGLPDLAGRVTVIDFIYTQCPGPCPLMSEKMKRLGDELKNIPGLFFLSVTVDPEHDTPAELRKYARKFGADPKRWAFATGEKDRIYGFSMSALKLSSKEAPSIHSTMFVLIDKETRIRGYYNSEDETRLTQLRADIRTLAR